MTTKVWIPTITDDELAKLAGRIKPVVLSEGKPHYIKPVDLRKVAFTWAPSPVKVATGLKPLADIRTYHTYGYYGFFKPSIAEVIAQIPKKHLRRAVAFEIVKAPETAEDLRRQWKAVNAGYHVATTRLYEKA
jgi:hypothetical protein